MTKVYTPNKSEYGIAIGNISQFCAGCSKFKVKLIVRWNDGKKTFICQRALEPYRKHLIIR